MTKDNNESARNIRKRNPSVIVKTNLAYKEETKETKEQERLKKSSKKRQTQENQQEAASVKKSKKKKKESEQQKREFSHQYSISARGNLRWSLTTPPSRPKSKDNKGNRHIFPVMSLTELVKVVDERNNKKWDIGSNSHEVVKQKFISDHQKIRDNFSPLLGNIFEESEITKFKDILEAQSNKENFTCGYEATIKVCENQKASLNIAMGAALGLDDSTVKEIITTNIKSSLEHNDEIFQKASKDYELKYSCHYRNVATNLLSYFLNSIKDLTFLNASEAKDSSIKLSGAELLKVGNKQQSEHKKLKSLSTDSASSADVALKMARLIDVPDAHSFSQHDFFKNIAMSLCLMGLTYEAANSLLNNKATREELVENFVKNIIEQENSWKYLLNDEGKKTVDLYVKTMEFIQINENGDLSLTKMAKLKTNIELQPTKELEVKGVKQALNFGDAKIEPETSPNGPKAKKQKTIETSRKP